MIYISELVFCVDMIQRADKINKYGECVCVCVVSDVYEESYAQRNQQIHVHTLPMVDAERVHI